MKTFKLFKINYVFLLIKDEPKEPTRDLSKLNEEFQTDASSKVIKSNDDESTLAKDSDKG